jgi:pimeloyl-ACP methyl ester carboxylesterase
VIDSVIAVGALPDAHAGGRVVIAGYSQGGHGALWANEVAPRWAPQLDVVATFAGAPATEMPAILLGARSLPIGGFLLSIVAGYQEAYPEADPSEILTPKGVSLLGAVDDGCVSDVFKAAAGVAPADLVLPDGPTSSPWLDLAQRNDPGQTATEDPVLIIHSDQDDVVPIGLSAALHDRMCRNHQVVERRVLVGGGGHGAAAVPAYTQGLTWLKDVLDGKAPVDDCGQGASGGSVPGSADR